MKTIADLLEEVKTELLSTGILTPRLSIEYACSDEEIIRFPLHHFPHIDQANAYFYKLGRQKRRANPDDRLTRLAYVSRAKLVRNGMMVECLIMITLTIDMHKPAFEQSLLVSRIVRCDGPVRALVAIDDVPCFVLNHHLISFLRGFIGERHFEQCAEALALLLVEQSERQM